MYSGPRGISPHALWLGFTGTGVALRGAWVKFMFEISISQGNWGCIRVRYTGRWIIFIEPSITQRPARRMDKHDKETSVGVLSWRSAIVSVTFLLAITFAIAPAQESKETLGPGSAKSPSSSSPQAEASPSLENTYWTLTKVGDVTVPESHNPRRAHLILNAEAHRVGGAGGCNGILGKYELSGDRLTFPGVGATRMACKEGMETEKAFLEALNQTKSWKITGRKLELLDGEGHTVAELETRSAKK